MGGPRVLVVEDERIVARDLQLTLQTLGYDCPKVAGSAAEALIAAIDHRPDLVLMDIQLQGAPDGIDCARALREDFEIPVVFLTAYSDADTLQRASEVGPHGYLTKPVRTDELRSTIEISLHKDKADRELRAKERWCSTTLNSIADAVVSFDYVGRVSFMNPVAETLTGWGSQEAVGKPVGSVVRLLDERGEVAEPSPVLEALGGARSLEINGTLVERAGGHRQVADSAAPIVDRGKTVGAVVVFRDVTEQQRIRRELDLAQRLGSLGTLAAGMAHQINNPLAFVLSSVELVREMVSQNQGVPTSEWVKEVDELLTHAAQGVDRIKRLVTDLGLFAHPASEGVGNPQTAIKWAVAETQAEFAKAGATLQRSGVELPLLTLNELSLGQLLVQVLVNAAQAVASVPEERRLISIEGRRPEDGWAEIVIQDRGVGITAEVMPRIFDPFFTTKEVGKGTGLGLAIVYGIVKSAGGTVSVESQADRGTTVVLRLPVFVAEPDSPSPSRDRS